MFLTNLKNRRYAFRIAVLFIVLVLATVITVLGMRNASLFANSSNASALTQTKNSSPIKVISLTVNPGGFSPSKVSVPEGHYLIDINNRSEFPDLDLQFGQLQAKKLKESHKIKDSQGRELKSRDWRGLFHLEPGAYRITERSHPDWIVEIQVTRK